MVKAWVIQDEDNNSLVVFAETRGKAKTIALKDESFREYNFCELQARRFPIADSKYDGREKMDWENPQDRMFLVKECDWSCLDWDDEHRCKKCVAKEYCLAYNEER